MTFKNNMNEVLYNGGAAEAIKDFFAEEEGEIESIIVLASFAGDKVKCLPLWNATVSSFKNDILTKLAEYAVPALKKVLEGI